MNSQIDNTTQQLIKLRDTMEKVNQCIQAGGEYQMQCASAIMQKSIRTIPIMQNMIYPWRNYDWSYATYVKKYYNPKKLGASGDGSMTSLINDISAIIKLIDGLLIDANPSDNSKASDPSALTNDLVDCLQRTSCVLLNNTKRSYLDQKPPYDDPFFNRKLDGEFSSSFFAQVGFCPSKISDPTQCNNKGYLWIPNPLSELPDLLKGPNTKKGSCFRGKYIYMDNKPGLSIGQIKNWKGLIPSISKDLLDLSPDKMMAVAMGMGVDGVGIQTCPETFTGDVQYKNNNNRSTSMCFLIIICLIIMILIYLIQKYLYYL